MSENNPPPMCPLPPEERRSTGIKIPVPWSKDPIEVRGLGTILSLALVAICLTAYMVYQLNEKVTMANALSVAEHVKIEEVMAEQTYVLTLSAEKREQLNLAMPPSLRRKIRERAE